MNHLKSLWIFAVAIVLFPLNDGFAEHHRPSISIADYRNAEIKLGKMIERGEVSEDRAEQRLKRMRLMVDDKTKPSVNNRRTFTEDEYLKAEVRVRKMIENGEVSKVRAEQRLKLMRQRIR